MEKVKALVKCVNYDTSTRCCSYYYIYVPELKRGYRICSCDDLNVGLITEVNEIMYDEKEINEIIKNLGKRVTKGRSTTEYYEAVINLALIEKVLKIKKKIDELKAELSKYEEDIAYEKHIVSKLTK